MEILGLAAIPAGVTAGLAYDASASAVTGEEQGSFAALRHAAENPSAGSVFDAIAIPVGDGLAGYSGGEVATKIRVNHLEGVRASKFNQIDAATTSGEALKYASEVRDLTAKINTMKHGPPKYWEDPKTGKAKYADDLKAGKAKYRNGPTAGAAAAEAASSRGSVPFSGYMREKENEPKKKQAEASSARFVWILNSSLLLYKIFASGTFRPIYSYLQEKCNLSYLEKFINTHKIKHKCQGTEL